MSSRPSASVETIGFPIASASNAVIGVPSQSEGKTLRSNADSVAATSRRKPAKTNRSPRSERRGLRLQVREQRPLADQKEPRAGRSRDHAGGRVDEIRIALRVVQPRDGADRELAGGDAQVAPRRRDFVVGPRAAELLERHAEVHDLHLRRGNLPRLDDEVGRALRDRQRDVGERLEHAIGHLLEPGGVGEVGVLVEDGRDPPHRAGEPSERRRAVAVQVEDVDPLAVDQPEHRRQRRADRTSRARDR